MLEAGTHSLARVARLLSVMIAVVALNACGGGDDDDPPSATSDDSAATAPVEATPRPEPTAQAGWRAVSGDLFALDVPERWVGGDPLGGGALDDIRALGGNCVAAADLIEPQAGLFEVVFVDPDTCAGSVRTIQVIVAPLDADDAAEFIADFVPGFPANATVLDQREGTLGGAPAAILRVQRDLGAFVTIQALYAIRSDGQWPILAAAAEASDFDGAAVEFDAIAQTFRAQ